MGATIKKAFKTIEEVQAYLGKFFNCLEFSESENCYKDKENKLYWSEHLSIDYQRGTFFVQTTFHR